MRKRSKEIIDLEEEICTGSLLYNLIFILDEGFRPKVLRGEIDPECSDILRDALKRWINLSKKNIKKIDTYIKSGIIIKGASEFKKQYEEAKWIFLPAKKAFNDPKMVALRDKAIDEMRKGISNG